MSYISAIRRGDDVVIWERDENGRQQKVVPAPFEFYTKDPNGTHESIYGDKLTHHQFETADEFVQARRSYDNGNTKTFEADIPAELKVLSRQYYGATAPKLNVSFYDIEVDYDPAIGFSSVDNPYAPINSIAFYHCWLKKIVVLVVPPNGESAPEYHGFMKELNDIAELPGDTELDLHFCLNERELLMLFLHEIRDADVISGWNSDFFDFPYIAERLKLISDRYFRALDFKGTPKPRIREVEVMGKINKTYDIHGRISVDYLQLFKKYEMANRHSYKLEYIADEFCPDLPKLEYEGSLAKMYKADLAWFVRYNIRDTEILRAFEDKLGYVEVANQMCHLSTGLFKHVTGTLKLADLATVNYCHHELGGLIVNDVSIPDEDGQIQGAFVLLPQVGEHEHIGSVDVTSLYPASIRSINISPETILGQFAAKVRAAEAIKKGTDEQLLVEYDDGTEDTHSAAEWRELLFERKQAISGHGTVFSQEKEGIIPSILGNWFATRKHYQRLMVQEREAGNKGKATYYDKLQYIYKIKLNSFYGALTNKYFRFYDLRMGESTTATGRAVLIHQCAKACEILDGEYMEPDRHEISPKDGKEHFGYTDNWSVVYGDTDSSYFVTHCENSEQATKVADRVGELINESFPEFMQTSFILQPDFTQLIKTGREIVSDKGIFVDKKRYILHIVDDDGVKVDKMKVMGLDTKKTTLPKAVSKCLNTFIERYLKGESWDTIAKDVVDYKEELIGSKDIRTIGLPKGVNKVEMYTKDLELEGDNARLPGHVAASIFYNQCLKTYDDKESLPITSGNKIRIFYLKQKQGRFKSIALPVDDDNVPFWFGEFEVDKDAAIERLVDNPLRNIIKAINKRVPTKQSLFVDEMVEF